MLLAYVDESGNTGDPSKGGSLTFTLGCVLVEDQQWPTVFDELVAFRRRLKTRFGIRVRDELKANYLLRGHGSLRALTLGPKTRGSIYRAHMRVLAALPGVRVFAVCVDKRHGWTSPQSTFHLAWEGLIQRLERTSSNENSTFMVVHDQGEDQAIRRQLRAARRHLGAGSMNGSGWLNNPARLLVDDPVSRQSHHAYLIQMADLVAYAGFRSYIPPGAGIAAVCPSTMWDVLEPVQHKAVNKWRPRAAPGIVIR